MRLGEVLSKPPIIEYSQVDTFLQNKKGSTGQRVDLAVGNVMLNYFCSPCKDIRTFTSQGKLNCIFVNKAIVSIDCVLTCSCGTYVTVWFLVESDDDICGYAPKVRILKRSEKLSSDVKTKGSRYGEFSVLLDMAERAYRDGLGAGSLVYLRKIFEMITEKTALETNITTTSKGKRRPFKDLLKEVDGQCSIIPEEFSANGYRLFGELSDVIHGEYDEDLGLRKFEPFHRLVIGILENVQNREEIRNACDELGWNNKGGAAQ